MTCFDLRCLVKWEGTLLVVLYNSVLWIFFWMRQIFDEVEPEIFCDSKLAFVVLLDRGVLCS
jgi:hypothetical protein